MSAQVERDAAAAETARMRALLAEQEAQEAEALALAAKRRGASMRFLHSFSLMLNR